mgnify:CR=1 FL=1
MIRLLHFLPLALMAAAPAAERPNVLLILADDLGFSDLSCYGSEIRTPAIDRLASGGAKFSAFYNSARCCPSRASLFTGLHPHEAGIGSFATARPRAGATPAYAGHLLPDTATLAEILGDAGYSTWMIGKWHMGAPGPMERGVQNYYGYRNFLAYAENQWDPGAYVRLPRNTPPEIDRPRGEYYATDVFSDYALRFLQQARSDRRPWFLFLSHSSPHFPVQAPGGSIDRHVDTYRRGWDVLRAERFERQKKLGLVPADAGLPPRSTVPVDRDDIANGFPGRENPAWDSLPADRREDLARRMATYAAMVEHVDRGVGRILDELERHGELENTLVLFLSDNGACYEWGPFGFDGPSRQGRTTLHVGAELERMGQDGTHSSYGSAWANLCNTPLNLYKHFCHEGGISSPLIVHWPAGLKPRPGYVPDPGHTMDIVPTVCAATGVPYPEERDGIRIRPASGVSLLPAARGEGLAARPIPTEHQGARGLRRGDWKIAWGKRQPDEPRWELYDLARDRSEQHDLAAERPEILESLVAEWEAWARRVGAEPFDKLRPAAPAPSIAKRPLRITAEVRGRDLRGVVLAQGGDRLGYALHFVDGRPTFDVRIQGEVTRIQAPGVAAGRVRLEAVLDRESMSLAVNGDRPLTRPSPGLIPAEPRDGLAIGHDDQSAAGDYPSPNPFSGTILDALVEDHATRKPLARPTTGTEGR